MRKIVIAISLLFCGVAVAATLSDVAKEKRWADQIVGDLIDGEAVWLQSDGHKFLGIFTEAASDPKGGIILAHGTGVHPNWAQVIYPLRVRLAEQGWHTLSIQLPILPNDARNEDYIPLMPEAAGRFAAAVNFLKNKGIKSVTLIGHSSGALLATEYAAGYPDPVVTGVVNVGVTSREHEKRNTLDELTRIKIPILDIYGDFNEEDGVIEQAPQRLAQAKKAPNPDYRQVQIKGSNHFHDGKEAELTAVVVDWLSQN